MKDLMIETSNVRLKRKVPQTWDELPLPAYLKCCEVFATNWQGLGVFPENVVAVMRQSLLYIITQTDSKFWASVRLDYEKEYGGDESFMAMLKDVLTLTDFFFKRRQDKDGVITYEARVTRTVCPYPVIYFNAQDMIVKMTLEGQKAKTTQVRREYEKTVREIKALFGKTRDILYYSSADGLDNVTFYELCALFQKYESYVNSGMKDSVLCELLAILYRPSKAWSEQNVLMGYDGDRRIPYKNSEVTVEARAQKLRLIAKVVKTGLLYWFIGCRTAIFENPRFKILFEGKGSEDPLRLGMYNVLFALQDSAAYNSETAQNENGFFALTYLASKMIEKDE